MSGFDGNHVFTVSVHDPAPAASTDSPSQTEKLLLEFLLQYRVGGEFIYRLVYHLLDTRQLLNQLPEISFEQTCSSSSISLKSIFVTLDCIMTNWRMQFKTNPQMSCPW